MRARRGALRRTDFGAGPASCLECADQSGCSLVLVDQSAEQVAAMDGNRPVVLPLRLAMEPPGGASLSARCGLCSLSGWAVCRASASTTTSARSLRAARVTRWSGIAASCTCAATTAFTRTRVRRRRRGRRARSKRRCAFSRAASGRRGASARSPSWTSGTPVGATVSPTCVCTRAAASRSVSGLPRSGQRCGRCRRRASTGPGTGRRVCRSTATCATAAASTARRSVWGA
jgi:hypothetical protein